MDRPVLTPKQAARRATVSRSLVYAWLKAGRLPGYRLGARGRGKWLIRTLDLDLFLDACRAAGPGGPLPETRS